MVDMTETVRVRMQGGKTVTLPYRQAVGLISRGLATREPKRSKPSPVPTAESSAKAEDTPPPLDS